MESTKMKSVIDEIEKSIEISHVIVTPIHVDILSKLTQNDILLPPDCSKITEIKETEM
jgi:ferredoxin-fold anticodon binding domain-containing protein